MANSRKRRKFVILTFIGIILVVLAAIAIFRKKDVTISVQTEKVQRRNLTELVMANGKIQPVTQVVISPEVAGEIVKLPVREGDKVRKGDLLVQVKPDSYAAGRNSAEASYKSAQAGRTVAKAELDKAEAEYKRNDELFHSKLVSDSVFLDYKTAYEVAKLRFETSVHQSDQAKFALDKANDDLSKTTILSPIDGTVTRLQSQLGERVLGTSFNKGTEIMTVSDLNQMQAIVDIGESDVVLIKPGQKARLEVDAFKDKKFTGVVTDIANSSKYSGLAAASQSQEATKFEVKIRIIENDVFRPGMSITAEIETRDRTNVLTIPFASVTTRLPKTEKTNTTSRVQNTNSAASPTHSTATATNDTARTNGLTAEASRKAKDQPKQIEVVFVLEGDHVKMVPVKLGISDADYWEITEGLAEGQEVVSGGYKAISKDLEEGKKIRKGGPEKSEDKEKK
jgi:HlyD family secretion protein